MVSPSFQSRGMMTLLIPAEAEREAKKRKTGRPAFSFPSNRINTKIKEPGTTADSSQFDRGKKVFIKKKNFFLALTEPRETLSHLSSPLP